MRWNLAGANAMALLQMPSTKRLVSLGEPYQDACYKLIAAIISAT